jgi:hypothetical protein
MKPQPSPEIERGRIRRGIMASATADGNNGAFLLQTTPGVWLQVIVSDGGGWEHVSVSPSREKRCPTWDEMCWVKSLFWEPEEVVIQYHPAESEYVTLHPFCLHLWKPREVALPTPPAIFVGPKPRHRKGQGIAHSSTSEGA